MIRGAYVFHSKIGLEPFKIIHLICTVDIALPALQNTEFTNRHAYTHTLLVVGVCG